MSIEIAGKRYPFEQAVVVGARLADARHPDGTETVEHPCAQCGATMLLDVVKLALAGRTGRGVVCLACAVAKWPEMKCGTHAVEGRAITLREAVERGWLGIGQAGDD